MANPVIKSAPATTSAPPATTNAPAKPHTIADVNKLEAAAERLSPKTRRRVSGAVSRAIRALRATRRLRSIADLTESDVLKIETALTGAYDEALKALHSSSPVVSSEFTL